MKILIIILFFLTSLICLSKPNNITQFNDLLSKIENYYNSNKIVDFKEALEKATIFAIENNYQQELINFLKNKFILQKYNNPIINEYIADSLFDLGELQESLKLYQKSIEYLNLSSHSSLPIASRIYYKISQVYLIEGLIDEYISSLNKSYIYQPDLQMKSDLKLQIIKDKINYFIDEISQESSKNKIIQEIQELINLSQNKLKLYINLLEIYHLLKMNDEKEKLFSKINNLNYTSLDDLIMLYKHTENKEKQKEILIKMVDNYPNIDPYYIEKLADLYLEENNNKKAKELYIKVISQIPSKHQTIYKLVNILYQEKDIDNAQKYIDLALKQHESPEYLELAADIYTSIDKNKAIQYYNKAYDLYSEISHKARIRKKISEILNK